MAAKPKVDPVEQARARFLAGVQARRRDQGTGEVYFGMSEEYADWKFIRCGSSIDRFGNPNAKTMLKKAQYIQMGFLEAEPTVRGSDYLQDGDKAVYVMCHPELYQEYRAWEQSVVAELMREHLHGTNVRMVEAAKEIAGDSIQIEERADPRPRKRSVPVEFDEVK